ncbi:5'/3'-nucleotidase SurE [Clostridium omnivorum]|uniref:5'-nucleotidase n=1 Tax=Clostridium omnivorum TaxID=1604902 RepID=A0ABQ5N9H0_9CLOT|nr:5'/3'-nucleotidase SurE [Clostridium sp. E14]GLC31816.1 stationary phase survival protein SurE [Clostridium sp. E14]
MKPLILVTNDDGVYSPGLCAAAEAVQDLGDLLVVAPRYQQTSMGRSFPKSSDVGIIEKVKLIINGCEIEAYGVHGSPAHAVSHGILELAYKKPDLCISGINYGENLGLSITCSGTVGAAFEADSYDISSIAVSRQADLSIQHASDYKNMDFEASKKIIRELAVDILKNGLPDEISILNVNVPDNAAANTEVRITKQGRSNYSVFKKPEVRDFSKSYVLSSEMDAHINKSDKNSDVYAIYFDKVISITPLTWNMSANTNWGFKRSSSNTNN